MEAHQGQPGPKVRILKPTKAFEFIRRVWKDGRPIVPLFGAGISVDAGIPTTNSLIDDLAKVKTFIEWDQQEYPRAVGPHAAGPSDPPDLTADHYREYLQRNGWPGRNQLNVDLLKGIERRLKDGRLQVSPIDATLDPISMIVARALRSQLRLTQKPLAELIGWASSLNLPAILADPTARQVCAGADGELKRFLEGAKKHSRKLGAIRGDWRGLLHHLTAGDPALIDSFFNRLMRGLQPATVHQFIAFFVQFVGWRLILTTNFDPLIERALRDQGLDPAVFELPEHGPAPHPRLIHDHLSVVKLHGGGFALRVGESLDAPLDEANIRFFLRYVPKGAVLLVIGYGGNDRRVMSLVEALVDRREGRANCSVKDAYRVIWVHRDPSPPDSLRAIVGRTGRPEAVAGIHYRDGGLFLEELYRRLITSDPSSRTRYRALPHVPSWVLSEEMLGQAEPDRLTAPVGFFGSLDPSGLADCSYHLAAHVSQLDNSHQAIWCDLEEIPSVDALIAILLEQFRRFDQELPQFVIPPSVMGDEEGRRARRNWICLAMRRGRYVVVIDSTGEFGRPPLARGVSRPAESQVAEVRRLYEFLDDLAEMADELGESKLRVALSPLEFFDTRTPDSQLQPFLNRLQAIEAKRSKRKVFVELLDGPCAGGTPFRPTQVKKLKGRLEQIAPTLMDQLDRNPWGNIEETMPAIWQAFGKMGTETGPKQRIRDFQRLLKIAAIGRRPRGIALLRRLGEDTTSRPDSQGARVRGGKRRFDRMLRTLVRAGLLIYQEGGFYWMRRGVRDWIDRQALDDEKFDRKENQKLRFCVAKAHEAYRDYYEVLFLKSGDIASFFESVHHSLEALRGCSQPDKLVKQIARLADELGRVEGQILSEGHTAVLLSWLDALREHDVLKSVSAQPEFDELVEQIDEMKIRILRESTAYEPCIRLLLGRLSRQLGTKGGGPSALAEALGHPDLKFDMEVLAKLKWLEEGHESSQIEGSGFLAVEVRDLLLLGSLEAADSHHSVEIGWDSLLWAADPARAQDLGWKNQEAPGARTTRGGSQPEESGGAFRPPVVTLDRAIKNWTKSAAEPGHLRAACGIADTYLELGLCFLGLNERLTAEAFAYEAWQIAKAAEAAIESLSQARTETRPDPTLPREARELLVRSVIRIIDTILAQVHPWSIDPEDLELGTRLRFARALYREGEKALLGLPSNGSEAPLRYRCHLSTLHAQINYLESRFRESGHSESGSDTEMPLRRTGRARTPKQHFSVAYRSLDTARACVYRMQGSRGETALAIGQLHYAEALMLHSDHEIASASEDLPKALPRARTKLDRAAVALDLARTGLLSSRRNAWLWTRYYSLRAQLQHERILWELSCPARPTASAPHEAENPSRPNEVGRPRYAGHRPRRVRARDTRRHALDKEILDGLRALHAARENLPIERPTARRSDPRRAIIEGLWNQFFTCVLFLEAKPDEPPPTFHDKERWAGAWQRWTSLNERAGFEDPRLVQRDAEQAGAENPRPVRPGALQSHWAKCVESARARISDGTWPASRREQVLLCQQWMIDLNTPAQSSTSASAPANTASPEPTADSGVEPATQ